MENVVCVPNRIVDHGLTIRLKTCSFVMREISLPDHILDARGALMDPEKVAAIAQ